MNLCSHFLTLHRAKNRKKAVCLEQSELLTRWDFWHLILRNFGYVWCKSIVTAQIRRNKEKHNRSKADLKQSHGHFCLQQTNVQTTRHKDCAQTSFSSKHQREEIMSAHFFSLELELPGLSNEEMPICHISYCVPLIKPILSHITEKEPTTGFALRHHFSP